jgi:hypothetical protein
VRKEGVLAAVVSVVVCLATTGVVGAGATAPQKSPVRAAPVTNGAWTVYHRDDAHTGFDPTQPTAAGATTGWVSGTFDAAVYAEPLVYQGVVYVATLNNTVYALNQQDGTTIWFKNLGAPTSSGWNCGNVSPQGILGTPVIDVSTNRIYVAALLSTHTYWVFGLDLANSGNVVLQTAIPTVGGFFDWKIQQERGALALRNGYVYVPMGGRDGDCNDGSIIYQGWVFAVPTSGSGGTVLHWNSGGAGEASIWAPGGIAVDDSTGRIFFATGQGGCPSTYNDYNDAVIRLSPTVTLEDYFAPFDWHNLSCTDADIGSASPVLISPTLAFQAGKPGQGYLVNPQSLGGIDGQLYPAKNTNVPVCLGDTNAANYGSYAYAAPYVYLECEGNGMVGLKIDTAAPSFSTCDATCASPSWHSGTGTYGAPIVAGGIVWAVSTSGAGLTGFDAATGAVVFQSAAFSARRFSTPTEAGGQIFVASNTVVREFDMVKACTGETLTATPPSPQTAGTPETLTASGVTNCTNPLYRFWMRPPGGSWTVLRNYSSSNTFNWTSDTLVGTYGLEVDVKSSASTAAYDSVANTTFTTTAPNACTNAGLALSPPSPGPTGASVTMTGSSSSCPNPQYRFWVKDPGRSWSMVQDYSSANTHVWSQTGLTGTYAMEVDVRNAGETVAYDVVFNTTYVLAGCTAASLSASPASPQPHGTTITLTATSTCPGTATYRFWIKDPGGRWSMVQDYSTSNTHTWSQTYFVGTYSLEVDVRDQGATSSYEVVFNTTFNAT